MMMIIIIIIMYSFRGPRGPLRRRGLPGHPAPPRAERGLPGPQARERGPGRVVIIV